MAWTDRFRNLFSRQVDAPARDARNAEVAPAAKGFDPPRFAGGGVTNVNNNPQLTKQANSVDALFGRITYGAGPTYTRNSSYPAQGLEPYRIREILREADLGIVYRKAELDEQILERDAHLRGIDLARKVEVSGKPFRVQARNETPVAVALANWIRNVCEEIDSLDQAFEDLLSANGRGYSASEISWQFERSRIQTPSGEFRLVEMLIPSRLDYVHQKHFTFDQFTDEPYLIMPSANLSLPRGKFIFHATSGTGLIERRGFMRACIWLHAAKQWALRDWLVFLHIYGIPQLEGVYDDTKFEADDARALYESVLRDFGQGIPAIHGQDFEIKITQPPTGGTAQSPHAAMIGWANAEMSKVVQGETLTTEVGGVGSYAVGDVHADVKHAIVTGDARKLAKTMRSDLFYPLVEMNLEALCETLGASPEEIKASIPTMAWRIDRETTPEQRASIISMAINDWGMEVDEEQQRDEFALNKPRPGSKPLPGKAQVLKQGDVSVGTIDASDGAKGVAPDDPLAQEQSKAPPVPGGDDATKFYQYEIEGGIVTINEVRRSKGLPAIKDGDLTLPEYRAKHPEAFEASVAIDKFANVDGADSPSATPAGEHKD
jgi:phage gp29-like protein